MGISERQSRLSKMRPYGAAPLSCTFWALAMNSSQVAGAACRVDAGLLEDAGVGRLHADVEQQRPDVPAAVDGAFGQRGREEIGLVLIGDVGVPRLDGAGGDQLQHLEERRHAAVHVPGAGLVVGFGDEAVVAEVLGRSDFDRHANWRRRRHKCRDAG